MAFGASACSHGLVLVDHPAHVRIGDVGGSPPAAHLVLGIHHLLNILDLELRLVLEGSGRLPVEEIGPAARVGVAQEHEHDHDEQDHPD